MWLCGRSIRWVVGRSADNWRSPLGYFAYPRLADMSVTEATAEDVLAVVAPVWQTRHETARNLNGHISAVMGESSPKAAAPTTRPPR